MVRWLLRRGQKVPSAEDINCAIKYFENKYAHVIFVVASDDKPWCHFNLKANNSMQMSNFSTWKHEFVLLCSCDHIIMTVGTFGWWAGWIISQKGGEVLYFLFPLKHKHLGLKGKKWFNQTKFYPKSWKGYNSNISLEK